MKPIAFSNCLHVVAGLEEIGRVWHAGAAVICGRFGMAEPEVETSRQGRVKLQLELSLLFMSPKVVSRHILIWDKALISKCVTTSLCDANTTSASM
jgi:hypothetical protein